MKAQPPLGTLPNSAGSLGDVISASVPTSVILQDVANEARRIRDHDETDARRRRRCTCCTQRRSVSRFAGRGIDLDAQALSR